MIWEIASERDETDCKIEKEVGQGAERRETNKAGWAKVRKLLGECIKRLSNWCA